MQYKDKMDAVMESIKENQDRSKCHLQFTIRDLQEFAPLHNYSGNVFFYRHVNLLLSHWWLKGL